MVDVEEPKVDVVRRDRLPVLELYGASEIREDRDVADEEVII